MAMKLTSGIKNARLDAIETALGTAPTLTIYSGSAPANVTDSATGTALAVMTLPSDWMAAASGGTKALAGTWQDSSADATGTAGYFRIVGNSNTIQGTVGTSGADLNLTSTSLTAGQSVSITSFTLTEGN